MELTPQERNIVQRCVDTHQQPHVESMGCIWRIGSGVCIGYAFLVFGIGLYCFASGRPEDVSTPAFERSAWIAVWVLTILGFLWQAHELRVIIAKLAGGAEPSVEPEPSNGDVAPTEDGQDAAEEAAGAEEPERETEEDAEEEDDAGEEEPAQRESEGGGDDTDAEEVPEEEQEDAHGDDDEHADGDPGEDRAEEEGQAKDGEAKTE